MSREHKKFERLFLFSEVAKQLSFTEAAAELEISRGYLSEQIRHLEVELGQPLLVRTTRSVKLTAQGEIVLASMGQVKQSLLELDRQIRHDASAMSGRLRITAPSQFTQRYLLLIAQEFRELYPEVQLSIDCSYTLFDLTKNDFDLAFRATANPPLNMVAKKLFDYSQVCCASPEYFRIYGIPRELNELEQHHCLLSSEESHWYFNQQSIELPHSFCVNDNQMLKELAIQSQGIIMGPEYLVDRELENGLLEAILTDKESLDSSIYLLHPQLIYQSVRLSSFIQFTIDWFIKHFAK
ncbi:MAG: LysR family transcriptional regulator [Kangiellaceae bacterium]|nr:LysR family transcriptional regulator [Kangiellaceae bacterium]